MKISASQVVMECLLEQGVDTVFGYPGGTILNIYDELELHGGRTNGFFKLITKLNSFSFSKQGREFIKIELNISNVWERMSE